MTFFPDLGYRKQALTDFQAGADRKRFQLNSARIDILRIIRARIVIDAGIRRPVRIYLCGRLKTEQELVCKPCKLAFPIRDDIPIMLEGEARQLAADGQ